LVCTFGLLWRSDPGIIVEMDSPLPFEDFPSEDELRPQVDPVTGIDLSLIAENMKLTPWERPLPQKNWAQRE